MTSSLVKGSFYYTFIHSNLFTFYIREILTKQLDSRYLISTVFTFN